MHQQFNIQQFCILSKLYLSVFFLSQNKQRILPVQRKLNGLYNGDEVFTARYEIFV